MRRVHLDLKKSTDHSYDIEIERGLLRRIASDLRTKRFVQQYVVIADKTGSRKYLTSLVTSLKREKMFLGKILVPSGEHSKSLSRMELILEEMIKLKANRDTGVIALGGGMVGDLAGFCAAVFMRGLPYVQIPTTFLAMVDSSIGGKVAVDLPSGKNMAGAFWQPKKVYVDPNFLSSLPQKQWKSGLAEGLKCAAVFDRTLWDFFEKQVELLNKEPKNFLPSDWNVVEEMIERSLKIKATIVMKDEKESDLRQIINYGHTFGHVIELMSHYSVPHGEAVATGMRLAAAASVKLKFMPIAEMKKQNDLLDRLGLGKTKTKGLIKDFIDHMKKDKKGKGDLRLVLVDRIGRCHQVLGKYSMVVSDKLVRDVLEESHLIDDKAVMSAAPEVNSWSQPAVNTTSYSSWSQPAQQQPWQYQYDSGTSYSSSPPSGETELQKRLREMRERRERAQREGKKWLPG